MKEVFVKKYWDEEDVMYYLHFHDDLTVRQIEVRPNNKVFLSLDDPEQAPLMYDQPLEGLEIHQGDFITRDEFEKAWGDR